MPTVTSPPTTEERWLTCRIHKGMFSDELVVSYPAEGEPSTSVFVPDSYVQGRPGETGKVRVVVTRRDKAVFVVIPSAEQDVVAVRESDLVP